MKIDIFYAYFNPYLQPKESSSNLETLEQLKANVAEILTQHPNAKVEWLQSFAGPRGSANTQLTAIVTY